MAFAKIKARLKQRNVTKQGMEQVVAKAMKGVKSRMSLEVADLTYYKHKLAYLKRLRQLINDEGVIMKKLLRDLKVERERLNLLAKNLAKVGYAAGQLPPNMIKMANEQYKKIIEERTKERRRDQELLEILKKQEDILSAMVNNIRREIAEMEREQGLTARSP